jgi:hypothetical protein
MGGLPSETSPENEDPTSDDDKVLELIDKVDANFSQRRWGLHAYMWIGLLLLVMFVVYATELTYQDLGARFAVAAAGIAIILSMGQLILDGLDSWIAGTNYRRLLVGQEDPILYALVLMKTAHPRIKLRDVYRVTRTLFEPEKLVESLYD